MNVVNLEEFKLKRLGIFVAPEEDIAAALDEPFFPVLSPGAEDDTARLQRAVLGLHKAALNQHTEVKKFRRVTLDLADKISTLEQSCIRFDRNIRRIRLDPLKRATRALSETMGSYLART
ncbi:MAG: hypothetical protein O3B76_11530 [Proteobacteria bacterium]|nr:hypothetical protein [Pseudomonadota bacterium]MDA1024111.1 hypothetical protein [Pseudomonadota bacterium]